MKIGYPCINRTLKCRANKTFRLKSYSKERLIDTVDNNLICLFDILRYNLKHDLLFFRITSDLIPFASHRICKFDWQDHFKDIFSEIGDYIKKNKIRISMHPDQFIVLNSKNEGIVSRSINELIYHTDVLDLMGLDFDAKIQLHVGGAYNDKQRSMDRFINVYENLDDKIKNRLVIENDHRLFSISDCIYINERTGIPILVDSYHHSILNNFETINDVLNKTKKTWKRKDGIQMLDYSSQQPDGKIGNHAESIDINDFRNFLIKTSIFDFDIMLEIKDKEKSANFAVEVLKNIRR
jgi:UV DNA damage endonuclease